MIKIGVIGCGAPHALNSHLPILASFPDVELAAFCDIDRERLDTAMNEYRVKTGFTDFRRMLDETSLDGVFVIVRPSRLREIVVECIKCGLPVSVEKAPGTSAAQTRDMLEEAKRRNCLNMVGFDRRYAIPVLAAKHLLGNHRILEVTGIFERTYMAPCDPKDAIIHGLDMMRFWGGEVARTDMTVLYGDEGVRSFELQISFAGGVIGHFRAGNYCRESQEYYTVRDSSGALVTADIANKGVRQAGVKAERDIPEIYLHPEPLQKLKGYWENRHFIDCIKSGQMPHPNLKDSLGTMEIAEYIKHELNKQEVKV